MVNDTISDLLTRIRNAGLAKQDTVSVINTKINLKITQILKKEGFIQDFVLVSNDLLAGEKATKTLLITLKYIGQREKPGITNIKRLSRPSFRVYSGYKDFPQLLNGMGVMIVTTPKGIMTDRDARSQKVGGELICSIW
jgi:small subunit ribosomal protein S8